MVDDLGAELEELDALLDPEGALEAQFRQLERGRAPGPAGAAADTGAEDPLEAMKRAMGDDARGDGRRLLLLVCPGCGRKNRAPLERLRRDVPHCGACGADLSFTR